MLPPRRALEDTVQSFAPPGSVGPVLLFEIQRGPILPPRGTKDRDRVLRIYDTHDYNALWQGARSGIVKKVASLPFVLNGPTEKVQYWQDMFGRAHFGHGWEYLLKLIIRDFLTQSYGGIFEIAGPGDPMMPLLEAPTGINHLDAGRCYVTGNPIYPVLYYSLWDGKLHRMHASRVYMMVDDPIADERYFGIGTSALERAIALCNREIRMAQYIDVKLDDKPKPGILALTGVSDKQWEARVTSYIAGLQAGDNLPTFGRTLVLSSLDPNAKVSAESIPFSQTPELFDFTKYTDTDVDSFALAIGVDRQELWQLSSGKALGTAAQSETLALKSRGKLYADLITGIERFVNWALLPDDCEFRIEEQDTQEDSRQAALDLQYVQVGKALLEMGFKQQAVAQLLTQQSKTFRDAFGNDFGQVQATGNVQGVTPEVSQDANLESDTPAPDERQAKPQVVAQTQVKAFTTTSGVDFISRFADILTRANAGALKRNQAENLMLGLLLNTAKQAYRDGLSEGGVTEDLDAEENQEVQNWVADQIEYLDPLLALAERGTLTEGQIDARAQMWASKGLTQVQTMGRMSADANGMYEFVGTDGKKTCKTCQRLKGQVHRFKDWRRKQMIPGRDTNAYECKGFQCRHTLQRTMAAAKGSW